ncbi:MAG: CoA transferase, partial [Pseudomonadota bacterium]
PRFATNPARVEHRTTLVPLLEGRLAGWPGAALLAAMETAGVPGGPILSVAEAFEDPQIRHRGLQIAPEGVPGVRTPILFSRSTLALERAAPGRPQRTAPDPGHNGNQDGGQDGGER